MWLCRKDLSDSLDSHELLRRPTRFLRDLYQRKHCQLWLKDRQDEMKEGSQTSGIPWAGNRLISIQLQTCVILQGKWRLTLKAIQRPAAVPDTTGPQDTSPWRLGSLLLSFRRWGHLLSFREWSHLLGFRGQSLHCSGLRGWDHHPSEPRG